MNADEKVKVALVAILLVYAGLVISPILLGDRVVEPFSELGILGPNMKLGDYPREVAVSEAFPLYLYLGNHEGALSYYMVLAKVGDRGMNVSESEPYGGLTLARYEYFLLDKTNVTTPISLSVSEPGLNRRLVFELYRYDSERGGLVYQGNWVQLWLNVTATR